MPIFLALCLLCLAATAAAAPQAARYLRTEYLTDPPIVAPSSPRFSWVLATGDAERGVVQSAYQIVITSAVGGAAVWDSGKVASAAQNQVAYAGPALASGTSFAWTVTWWDGTGAAAPVSATAHFGTSPGDDAAWAAAGSEWIGCTGVGANSNQLRLDFASPPPAAGVTISQARLYIAGLGWHIAYLNGQRLTRSILEPAFTHLRMRVLYAAHDVTALLDAGGAGNTLAVYLGNGWPNQFQVRLRVCGRVCGRVCVCMCV